MGIGVGAVGRGLLRGSGGEIGLRCEQEEVSVALSRIIAAAWKTRLQSR